MYCHGWNSDPSNSQAPSLQKNEVIFNFIKHNSEYYAVGTICRVMGVSSSAYYAWVKCPGQLIRADTLYLHRRAKALFKDSRQSLGRRELMKKLREGGFQVGRCKVRGVMKTLGLTVTQRLAYSKRLIICTFSVYS